MMSKIILMLIISSQIIGCIDAPKSIASNINVNDNTQSETSKIPTISIQDYLQYKLDYKSSKCTSQMTTIQCQNFLKEQENTFYRNVDNKYIYDSGVVIDVNRDYVVLETNLYDTTSPYVGTRNYGLYSVILKGISDENKLKINKGERVFFLGKVNIKSQTSTFSLDCLYDIKIGERTDVYNLKELAPTEPSITSGISKISSDVPKSKTFDVSYVKINDSYIQINVKNIGKESFSNFNFNIGSQRSPVLGKLNPGDYLSATFNINEIQRIDNNIDIWINYVWSGAPRTSVLRIPITT